MNKWLIIGSEGSFGKSLVRVLLDQGKTVFGFDLKVCSEFEGERYSYLRQDAVAGLASSGEGVRREVDVAVFS